MYNIWNKVVIRINYNKNKYNYRNYLITYIYIKIYTNLNFSKKYINEISLKDYNSESKTNDLMYKIFIETHLSNYK